MYRGFNIVELELPRDPTHLRYFGEGYKLYEDNLAITQATLQKFLRADNSLDGTAIQDSWFPLIKADVFISHSHANFDLAVTIAGWLKTNFGLSAFVDKCIWGHSAQLLKEIDEVYSKKGPNLYSYEERNHSTAHVHMMLSCALQSMIDNTECIFFLNTGDSIKAYKGSDKTESPWIYAEILATQILRQRIPTRPGIISEKYFNADGMGQQQKKLKVTYDVNLTHLTKLDLNQLNNWHNKIRNDQHKLDTLYDLYPIKN